MWEKALRNESLETNNAKDLEQVVRIFVEVDVVSAFSNSTTPGCEQSRSEMERWTGTPEGKWNVLRMFQETHAISAIESSTKTGSDHLIQKQKNNTKGENKNEL